MTRILSSQLRWSDRVGQLAKSLRVIHVGTSRPNKILDDTDPQTEKIRKELSDLPDKYLYEQYSDPTNGWVYDKKPFKYRCKAGKTYLWCACGRSHQQPFCDGTHRVKHFMIQQKPIRWDCTETRDYWFCNCKHTKHRPFCDGTHKLDLVQQSDSTIKDSTAQVTTRGSDVKKYIKQVREKGFQEDDQWYK